MKVILQSGFSCPTRKSACPKRLDGNFFEPWIAFSNHFVFYTLFTLGVLNVHHHVESTSSDKQVPADLNYESNSEDQAVDSRYLEGDFSDVDPAILEKLAVYIARYSYDPLQHSPNDNPEMELAFQAGDYLYVFGEMDEVSRGPGRVKFLQGTWP